MTLTRGLDVVFSPIMSSLTDMTVSRWGRRKPYLVIGCFPCGLALFMLLFPPFNLVTERSSDPISLWYGGVFLVFNLLQAAIVAPYEALASELAKERRSVRSEPW